MIDAETLARLPLFEGVPEHERAVMASRSADVRAGAGEWLVLEGEAAAFYVIVEGRVEIVKIIAGAEHVLAEMRAGEFFGEIPLMLGTSFVAGFRAVEPTRLMRIEPIDFHDIVAKCPNANRLILGEMARRIQAMEQIVIETPVATVTVFGNRWDFECYDLRDFLTRNHVAFRWVDSDDAGALETAGLPDDLRRAGRYPVVRFADGSYATAPTFRELAERLGLQTRPSDGVYDLAIVGAGPAGLAAAVYGASEGLRTVLVECRAPGGQAGTSSRIENYLGFPAGLSGDELSSRALLQAHRFGAEILTTRQVTAIEPRTGDSLTHTVVLDGGERIESKAVVLASGVTWRKLATPGAEKLLGRGVYYGAARAEALAARGKDVFLIGGGNSAGQAAMLFSIYARSATILVRAGTLAASMSQYLIDELAKKENVSIEVSCECVSMNGARHLESLDVMYAEGKKTVPADAVFVFIGAEAETEWLPKELIRDERGFVCTGRDVVDLLPPDNTRERDPYLLETSIPGIFAAGDVRHGSMKRVASGVGEGSMAIALVHQYLKELAPPVSASVMVSLSNHDVVHS